MPFPAGGTVDVLTRIVGERLAAKWGQPVVVENRVGAAGNIGTEAAARAEPDGYTLLASPPPALVINQHLRAKLTYDPAAFVPVTVMGAVPNVLAINPGVPVNSVASSSPTPRQIPDKLSFASTGAGVDAAHADGDAAGEDRNRDQIHQLCAAAFRSLT